MSNKQEKEVKKYCNLAIENLRMLKHEKNVTFILVASFADKDGSVSLAHVAAGSMDSQIGLLEAFKTALTNKASSHFNL